MFSTFKIVSLWFSCICPSAPSHSVFKCTNIVILTAKTTNSCFCLNTLYHNTRTLHPQSFSRQYIFHLENLKNTFCYWKNMSVFVVFGCRSSRICCSVKQLDTDWFFVIQFQKCNLFFYGLHAQNCCCARTKSLPLFTNALYPVNRKVQHVLHLVSISRMTGWWLMIFYITIERWSQKIFNVILHYLVISKICKRQRLFGLTTLCLSETSYWVCEFYYVI